MKYTKLYLFAFSVIIVLSLSSIRLASIGPTEQKPKSAEKQDDQAIRLGTQLVTVPFNVTDKKNRYINDLSKDDIDLSEDNKPQQFFSFERQTDLPITVAIVIDISGSMEYVLPSAKLAGQRFFQKVLRPKKDLGAVVTFEGESVLLQDLTSDVMKLQHALDGVRLSVARASAGGAGRTPPINGDPRAGSTALYDAIYSVSSDLLRREAGRRVIILITDGVDTSSQLKMRDAIERTWRSEVIVYAIGIGDPRFDDVDSGTLKKITAETGGRAFFPRRDEDLDAAFAQIDEDLRSQYILAYEPANGARDGSFRTIQLRIKNRKDLAVRHRRGYFAPKQT